MMACSRCGVEQGERHKHWCPRQTQTERIKELEETLRIVRAEIGHALDDPSANPHL